jgi:hypothetical protein
MSENNTKKRAFKQTGLFGAAPKPDAASPAKKRRTTKTKRSNKIERWHLNEHVSSAYAALTETLGKPPTKTMCVLEVLRLAGRAEFAIDTHLRTAKFDVQNSDGFQGWSNSKAFPAAKSVYPSIASVRRLLPVLVTDTPASALPSRSVLEERATAALTAVGGVAALKRDGLVLLSGVFTPAEAALLLDKTTPAVTEKEEKKSKLPRAR